MKDIPKMYPLECQEMFFAIPKHKTLYDSRESIQEPRCFAKKKQNNKEITKVTQNNTDMYTREAFLVGYLLFTCT